jgi:hypothetical protein
MTIAIICVILAFLPIVAAGIAKFGPLEAKTHPMPFDNNNPRQWLG